MHCMGYGSRFVCVRVCVCVCLHVCYHVTSYIPVLYIKNKVPLGSQDFYCVAFVDNALFKVLAAFADHLCLPRFLMSS